MISTEEMRQKIIEQLETDIENYEKYGGDEFGPDFDSVHVDITTARRTVKLLKELEAPVYAKWHYYTNDEGKARWKCTNCGKRCRRDPNDKKRCSNCGAYNSKEA